MVEARSITRKFVVTLLLILAVGQGIGVFLYLRDTKINLTDSLQKRMQRSVKQAADVMAEPVANYNFAFIDSYVTLALEDEDMVSVKVIGTKGQVIHEKTAKRDAKETFSLKEPIKMYDDRIGTIEMVYTKTTIDATMGRSLLVIPIFQGAMLLVVAVVLVRLFNTSIKRPLHEINKVVAEITAGDLTVTLPVLGKDEIGAIAEGIRFLVEKLRATIAGINATSLDVTTAINQLNVTFDNVVRVVNNQQTSTEEVSIAVRDAMEAQKLILTSTEKLLSFSGDNASALLQMSAGSEEIAATTDALNKNLNNSYSTLSELTQSARQIAGMSNHVAVAVEGASASVEEIFRSLKEVETLVKESSTLSYQTTEVISDKGMDAIADATESMRSMESFIHALTSAIDRLDNRSKDIEKILAVIEDVTEKTRLLSFNAQIIAAQAGEYGKGFAVVANQMKELSDRTALSTKEIENIVMAIQTEITEVVSETKETVKVVRDGNDTVMKTGDVLKEIFRASEKVSQLTKNIERASHEQTKGLELVVSATEEIKNRMHEVNRATAEQETSTSYLLKNIAPIKESMEATRRATVEQAKSTRLISSNIENANKKTIDIAAASNQQQQLNEKIITAMDRVMKMGKEAAEEVQVVSPFIGSLRAEVEFLKKEIEVFKMVARRDV